VSSAHLGHSRELKDEPVAETSKRNNAPEPFDKVAPTQAAARNDSEDQWFESEADRAARFTRDAIPTLNRLFGQALRMTHNYNDAEDLLQETALKAYTAFCWYRPGTNLAAWLRQIMTNAMIDDHRRRLRRPLEQLVDELPDWHLARDDRHPTTGQSAEAEVLDRLFESETAEALQSLNDGDRAVVYYAAIEGYRHSEIAEALEIPVGTVASRLYNARRRLRMQLRQQSA
jgi:RNA polymerase sigma-70 factor (ECF subfamily)